MATVKTIAVNVEKRFNTGDFESLKVEVSLWVGVSEEEDDRTIAEVALETCRAHILSFRQTWDSIPPPRPYKFNAALSDGEVRMAVSKMEEEVDADFDDEF